MPRPPSDSDFRHGVALFRRRRVCPARRAFTRYFVTSNWSVCAGVPELLSACVLNKIPVFLVKTKDDELVVEDLTPEEIIESIRRELPAQEAS